MTPDKYCILDKGKLNLAYPVILAPLAGISALPFRLINRKAGCICAFAEMVHARSLSYNNIKTRELLRTVPSDQPLGVQLLGNEPYYLEKALEQLEGYDYDILDFNAACPERKVVVKGEGAALLKDLHLFRQLLEVLVQRAAVPVTVKIRLGWDSAGQACDIARAAEDAGVAAVFVHGRTRAQGYSGKVNYKAIAGIKKSLRIPVIASGDIFNASLAQKMLEETGADALLVARGAFGNPWIFREIYALLNKEPLPQRPEINEIADVMKEHFHLCGDYYGRGRSAVRFRIFFVWYTRGVPGIKALRSKVMHAADEQSMLECIEEFREKGQGGKNP
ncbi:MAG: tRNA dihydrouridine synthase DusB [Candidatus Omnitrophica bacterium]|nr:tRNA dihydrouridine synthase DusB [Candidatus Omnitrophota bacterium]MBU4477652.1 tRNA dihydrouridine synthase DusB [Candidatus Omnitrophota bacterium]MCG2703142.1 tRNA dihydrouridine synthase DusB [Candidatus Omnitrophota bacterium]